MAQVIINTFTQFQQTEQEQLVGTTLNMEQKQFLQTTISKTAEQRLALVPDPNNYPAFIQQEAYLKGQMDMCKYLLDCSDSAEQSMKDSVEASAQ